MVVWMMVWMVVWMMVYVVSSDGGGGEGGDEDGDEGGGEDGDQVDFGGFALIDGKTNGQTDISDLRIATENVLRTLILKF